MNREFTMLANVYTNQNVGGWYVSEKLDGMRCLWLPDTVGHRVGELPFANLDKDRTQNRHKLATGLWSRLGKPIWAPSWFTEKLPKDTFLDGELWSGGFQELMSVVKDHVPGEEWDKVKFYAFDSPCPSVLYGDGKITKINKNFKGLYKWMRENTGYQYTLRQETYAWTYHRTLVPLGLHIKQVELPYGESEINRVISTMLDEVVGRGGEGLILRNPMHPWQPIRTNGLLKVKPFQDDEGVIVGFTDGKGRLKGMVGAAIIEWKDQRFKLSGFTDLERGNLKIGDKVTFKYRGFTDDGVPREARYHRNYQD